MRDINNRIDFLKVVINRLELLLRHGCITNIARMVQVKSELKAYKTELRQLRANVFNY